MGPLVEVWDVVRGEVVGTEGEQADQDEAAGQGGSGTHEEAPSTGRDPRGEGVVQTLVRFHFVSHPPHPVKSNCMEMK